jgi:type II secretory pathway pseudopilin PulG
MFKRVSIRRGRGPDSFTLVELLTVIAIIVILAALTLAAGEGVMTNAARNRAKAEVAAYSTGLENYKTDNAAYPSADTFSSTNNYATADPVNNTNYIYDAQILYEALSGKTNYTDTPVAGVKSYVNFKANQLGSANASPNTAPAGTTGDATYVQDPFGYAYGYYTGDTPNNGTQQNPPNNGTGFFDFWSTGGNTISMANYTNAWIVNWQ